MEKGIGPGKPWNSEVVILEMLIFGTSGTSIAN